MQRVILGVLLALGLSLLQSGNAQSAPRVTFPVLEYDFGKIKEGEKATHRFEVANKGDEPLEIKRVIPDCGCTATSISENRLEPGQKGEITVVFDSQNRGGGFEKHIQVVTNDPQNSLTLLKITGTVEDRTGPTPFIEINNPNIDFGVIDSSAPHEFALGIGNAGQVPLVVKSIKSYRGEDYIDSEIALSPGEKRILHLVYQPRQPGVIHESLTFFSNDPRRPQYLVFLSGYGEGGNRIVVTRKNESAVIVSNHSAEKIMVAPLGRKGPSQKVGPSKQLELDLGPGEKEPGLSISFPPGK